MKNCFLWFILVLVAVSCRNVERKDNQTIIITTSDSLKQEMLQNRRQRLMKMTHDGIVIIRADYGYSGGRHEFRAANEFHYLTDFDFPGSLLILEAKGQLPYTLCIDNKEISDAIYTGDVPTPDEIKAKYHAVNVITLIQSDSIIEKALLSGTPLYVDYKDKPLISFLMGMKEKVKKDYDLFRNIGPVIDEMRVIKDTVEVAEIQKAIDITGTSFIDICRICKPGMNEYEMEALIEYIFRKNGSSMPAFSSIVGSGPNTVKLHYSENVRKMEQGDMLLMDIGSEYEYYCADITRTIPVNGKFKKEQAEIYELVLKAQKAAIEEMLPGKPFVASHNKATNIIVSGLYSLGLITDTTREWQKKFYTLYPVSHYLGMDVHDVGEYGTNLPELRKLIARDTIFGRTLEAGMVLTIEPGLYFRSNGLSQLTELFGKEASAEEIKEFMEKVTPVYEKYKNIGIRIEDDILITDTGYENLSKDIPKEIKEIENLMNIGNRINNPF